MKSLQWLDKRAGYAIGSLAILLGVVAPAAFPMLASAAVLQSRSIAMTSSATSATGVSYDLKFTASTGISSGGGIIIDFCTDTPIIGVSCSTTNDVNASAATLGAVKYDSTTESGGSAGSISASATNIKWTAGAAYTANQAIDITFANITNPSTAGTFYARVTTYTSSANLSTYSAPSTVGTFADDGGIALSATSNLNVSAYVQEALTFCVSKPDVADNGGDGAPTAGCGGTLTSPSLQLGETINGSSQKALESSTVSTGEDFAQVSSNAAHGVIVNLSSDAANCGGLVRKSDGTNCDIVPQNSTSGTINAGDAKFGLELGSSENATGGTASGTITNGTHYGGSSYYLDYNSSTPTTAGITSPYGSELFDTTGAPVQNKNVPITFGASVSSLTPAGIYSANLGLIATGTF